ncbi:FKBP-type peptidyl-prolyl cis-trans isomerase [Stigmatella erecta]|nr:FKBP-type peptidyl-prolyl cis-trans isomerase [Stigmatella erecta]
MRRRVEQSAAARALATGGVELPKVQPPSLENLEVTVPRATAPSRDALLERYHELRREHARRRQRSPGEPAALGDEVVLDILGFAHGQPIPGSARLRLRLELAPRPVLPGLFEGMVGLRVGDSTRLLITLPPGYPVEGLRGAKAEFLVMLHEAWELTFLPEDSAEFFTQMGRGMTLEEVMHSIAEELEEQLSDELWLEAEQRVLDEVAERTQVELPASLIDEELRRAWGRGEGRTLISLNTPLEHQEFSLQAWLADDFQRQDAVRRLRVSLGLQALIESGQLQVTADDLHGLLDRIASDLGLSSSEVKAALKEDRGAARTVAQTALHLKAVEYVMDRARIHFEGAEEGRAQLGKA